MLMLGTPSREAAAKGGSVADWRRPIQETERLPPRLRAAIPTPIGAFRSAPQMETSHAPHGNLAAGGRPRIDGDRTGRVARRRAEVRGQSGTAACRARACRYVWRSV